MKISKLPIIFLIIVFISSGYQSVFAQCDLDPVISYQQDCADFTFLNELGTADTTGYLVYDWYWELDGSYYSDSWSNVIIPGLADGTHNVEFFILYLSTCTSSVDEEIYVYHSVPEFSYELGCPGTASSFFDETEAFNSDIVVEPVEWYWEFSGGIPASSTDQNPTTVFIDYGNYPVSLDVTNNLGCTDNVSQVLKLGQIDIDFTFEQYCDSIFFRNFTDTSNFGMNGIVIDSTIWSMGYNDVKIYQYDSVSYIYPEENYFEVRLDIFTNYCDTFMIDTVYVFHQTPSFDYVKNCVGELTYFYGDADTITILQEVIQPDTLFWDLLGDYNFGDGDYDTSYAYTVPGDYYVQFMTKNNIGCTDTVAELITIGDIDLDFSFKTPLCQEVEFVNLADTFNIQYDSVLWDFGDLETSTYWEPVHTYDLPNTYDVQLILFYGDGCSDTVTKSVLSDFPSANFDINYRGNGLIEFISTSETYISPIVSYFWDFGNGQTSNSNSDLVEYDFEGAYEVCLTVTTDNGCTSTYCDMAYFTFCPDIKFTYHSDTSRLTKFYDETIPDFITDPDNELTYWHWEFGDGMDTTYYEFAPEFAHQYEDFIEYIVDLTVCDRDSTCCTLSDTIFAGKPIVLKPFEYEGLCEGDTTLIYSSYDVFGVDEGTLEWHWSWPGSGPDSTHYEEINPMEHYFGVGEWPLQLILSGEQNGDIVADTLNETVNIYQLPIAEIDSDSVCLEEPIQFYVYQDYNHLFGDELAEAYWDFGDGNTSTQLEPNHLYADTGSYVVTLDILTANGCAASDSTIALVNLAPNLDAIEIEHACILSPTLFFVDFDTTSTDISTFVWEDGDGSPLDTTNTPYTSHVYEVFSFFRLHLKAFSGGCSDTISSDPFLVYPTPISDFEPEFDYYNVAGQIFFHNLSIDPSEEDQLFAYWDFGNGNTSDEYSPTEVYEEDGIYDVMLVSINNYGCTDTIIKQHEIFFKGLYVPTALSPNNTDEEVAYFFPKGINLDNYHMQVFDLKGNLLWESTALDEFGSPTEYWDGYYNGFLMPQGTYIWKAEASFRDGTKWQGNKLKAGEEEPKPYGTVTIIN